MPIDDSNQELATNLLDSGFEGPSVAFWSNAFDRIKRLGENSALGIPIGHMMFTDQKPIGIALTIASQRTARDLGSRVHVNFAAWYVDPEHRWRAPLMLRALSRVPCDVLTDLTPSDTVRAILPAFGFRQITQGITINLAAFHRGGGHVSPLEDADAKAFAPGLKAMLCAHAPFDNIPLALHCRDGELVAVLLRISRWRGLKMAHVLYSGSNTQLFAHLGALSAHLRKNGAALIKLDAPIGMEIPPGWMRLDREVRYARGELPPDVTDYAVSELALLDFQRNRNPPMPGK